LTCPIVYFGLFGLNKYPGVQKLKKKKKWLKMFRLRRAPLHYNKFHLGKKYKSRKGGGGKMNFKFKIHPCKNMYVEPFIKTIRYIHYEFKMLIW